MVHDLIIAGGCVVTPGCVAVMDIAISDGRIAAIGTGLAGAERIDATDLIVTPGGVDPRQPLMFDAMVTRGRLGLGGFARLTSEAPAALYGLQGKGRIAPGYDADLVLWDPAQSRTYGANDLHDNVGYNPWEGTTVTGLPVGVFLRGQPVMRDGEYLGQAGAGRWIDRPAIGTRPHDLTGTPS